MTARSTSRPLLLAIAAVLLVDAAPAAAFNPQPDPPGRAALQASGTRAVADSEGPHARVLIRGEVN